MQLLQFWCPRSEALDRALVGSIRLPFLFDDFSPAAERVTTRILQSMSRFEDIEDLEISTITDVLTNEALRRRLGQEVDKDEAEEAVREALVMETQRLEIALSAKEQELARLAQETLNRENQMKRDLEAARTSATRVEARSEEARLALAGSRAALKKQQGETQSLRHEIAEIKEMLTDTRKTGARTRVALAAVVFAVLAIAMGFGVFTLLRFALKWPAAVALGAASILALLLWAVGVEVTAGRDSQLRDWKLIAYLRRSRKVLLAGIAAVGASVLGSAIWTAFQHGKTR